jgi:hypothetical protein
MIKVIATAWLLGLLTYGWVDAIRCRFDFDHMSTIACLVVVFSLAGLTIAAALVVLLP